MNYIILIAIPYFVSMSTHIVGGFGEAHDLNPSEKELYHRAITLLQSRNGLEYAHMLKYVPLMRNPLSIKVKTQVVAGLNLLYKIEIKESDEKQTLCLKVFEGLPHDPKLEILAFSTSFTGDCALSDI
ncbi:hypothetical protein HZS_1991 [Henneguya salminicola]|nr:hypothetical protein HZS_1991 [Henneguya salminicola]